MGQSSARHSAGNMNGVGAAARAFSAVQDAAGLSPLAVRGTGEAKVRTFVNLLRACAAIELNGLPFPVHYRNCGVVHEWKDFLDGTSIWPRLTHPERRCSAIADEIRRAVTQPYLEDACPPGWLPWRFIAPLIPVQCGALIKFENEGGKLIEVTPALETLLINTDADMALPMSAIAPPQTAQYIKFGLTAANALGVPQPISSDRRFDGAFCFLTPPETANTAHTGMWSLELVFVVTRNGNYDGNVSLSGITDRMQGTLGEWLADVLASRPVLSMQIANSEMAFAVSYVVKVLLYMGLTNVRNVVNDAFSVAYAKLTGLGPRKQAKMIQRMAKLYDSIVVGPAALPVNVAHGQRSPVAAHWRRGHFRMQPFGPNKQERKLIFISPILVHADQFIEPCAAAR